MAAKALDDYMHNLERGYSCGYLNIGKDPAAGAYPERRPPWQYKAIPYRSFPTYKMTAREQRQVILDRDASIERKSKAIELDDAEITK